MLICLQISGLVSSGTTVKVTTLSFVLLMTTFIGVPTWSPIMSIICDKLVKLDYVHLKITNQLDTKYLGALFLIAYAVSLVKHLHYIPSRAKMEEYDIELFSIKRS